MSEFTQCKVKVKLGTVGDLATEWMTDKEVKAFWEDHSKYVEQLKAKGDYLKEVEFTINIENDPFLDPPKQGPPCESYRLDIINIGEV